MPCSPGSVSPVCKAKAELIISIYFLKLPRRFSLTAPLDLFACLRALGAAKSQNVSLELLVRVDEGSTTACAPVPSRLGTDPGS